MVTCECCDSWNSWSFGDSVLHHPKWIQCDLLIPVTLSLSSHTIRSANNNPLRHWKDPQTSQVSKCPDIFRKCPTGTKLRIALKIQGKLITPLEPPPPPTTDREEEPLWITNQARFNLSVARSVEALTRLSWCWSLSPQPAPISQKKG